MKNFNDFANDLGQRESGNDYTVKNKWGFLGRFQFGRPRLYDLGFSINGWKPKDGRPAKTIISEKKFLNSPHIQDEVFERHVKDILTRVRERYSAFIGREINGIKITESGLVAGVHLKGFGGVNKFLKGEDNSDALGTKVSEYIMKFGGYNLDNHLHIHLDIQNLILK